MIELYTEPTTLYFYLLRMAGIRGIFMPKFPIFVSLYVHFFVVVMMMMMIIIIIIIVNNNNNNNNNNNISIVIITNSSLEPDCLYSHSWYINNPEVLYYIVML